MPTSKILTGKPQISIVIWQGNMFGNSTIDDTRELLNYHSAFEFVSQCLDSGAW